MRLAKAVALCSILVALSAGGSQRSVRRIPVEWSPSPALARALAAPAPDLSEGAPPVSLKIALPEGAGACSLEIRDVRWVPFDAGGPIADGPEALLGQRGVWHGIPYQEILVRPARVSPKTGRGLLMKRFRACLAFEGERLGASRKAEPLRLSPEATLFVNPQDALVPAAAGPGPARAECPEGALQESAPAGFRVSVSRDGLYRLDYAYLAAHGFNPSGTDPRTLRMTCQGIDVPIYVEGESDGRFDPGDAVVFYGQKLPLVTRAMWNGGDFTNTNVYWLAAGSTPGPRMQPVDAAPQGSPQPPGSFPASAHFETDSYLDCIDHFRPNGDLWYWGPILMKGVTGTYTLSFPHKAGTSVKVTAVIAGLSAGDHSVTPALAGAAPSAGPNPATWSGKAIATFEWTFPAPPSASAALTLTVPDDVDYVVPDYFDATFDRTFESDGGALFFTAANAAGQFACPGHASAPYVLDLSIRDGATGLCQPRRLTGCSFASGTATFRLAPDPSAGTRTVALSSAPLLPDAMEASSGVDLSAPSSAADLLVITHPDFVTSDPSSAWQRYLALRQSEMVVKVVTIQDVYDNFSGGIMDPTAIRKFLAASAQLWSRPPGSVLLIGDASYDYKNVMGDSTFKDWVPTMCFEDMGDSTYLGHYLSDAWFSDVDGDGYPDMAVGRIPVRSLSTLEAVLGKILTYESQQLSGGWYRSVLYVSDTYNQPWEQEFEAFNNSLMATYTTAPWTDAKVYFHDPPFNGTDADAAAAAVRAAWPQAGLVHYAGHSGIYLWGNHAAFFTSYPSRNCGGGTCKDSDVGLLPAITADSAPLPFVLNSSCYSSAFDEVGQPSLMEALSARGDGGGIGSCGFSTIAFMGEEELFNGAIFGQLFQRSKVRAAGDLVDSGRFALPSSNPRSTLGTVLLGDPSLRLRLPAPPPPSALAAAAGEGSVSLEWTPPGAQPSGYNVYRSDDLGSTWVKVNSSLVQGNTYTDENLQGGRALSYYVVSVDPLGFEGPPSPVVSATPVPLNPYLLPHRSTGFTDPPPYTSGG